MEVRETARDETRTLQVGLNPVADQPNKGRHHSESCETVIQPQTIVASLIRKTQEGTHLCDSMNARSGNCLVRQALEHKAGDTYRTSQRKNRGHRRNENQ